jgi:hypothetical protein
MMHLKLRPKPIKKAGVLVMVKDMIRRIFGTIVFYCLLPFLLLLCIVWWKEHSLFIMSNIKMYMTGKP